MGRLFRYIYALFCPHFVELSEAQFQEMEIEMPRVEYNRDRIAESFKDSPLRCCNGDIETAIEVVDLYGGRGVKVLRNGRCPQCNQEQSHEMRMRDGYLMRKADNGEWILTLREGPIVVRWFRSLFQEKG